jgi:dolichyl-phosphate-mannose-protein mannosyltransferase
MAKGNGAKPKGASPAHRTKPDDYTSEGVDDNDVFLLPISDYNVMAILTVLGAIVRMFRIYQPSSVVFDEVQ